MFSKFTAVPKDQNTVINPNAHRIFVIDCSGSMYGAIDEVRTHLKNKIPALTRPNDFVSIIWFQHEGHFGCLQEHVRVDSLSELQLLNSAMDTYLRAGGGTHFSEAMELANEIAEKYAEQTQIFFCTDGCENSHGDRTRNAFKASMAATVLVMYGYYVDEEYLQSLADESNGVLIFSKEFEKLGQSIDAHLQNSVVGKKGWQEVRSAGGAFLVENGELSVYKSREGVCKVREGTTVTLYNGNANDEINIHGDEEFYGALWYAFKSRNADLAWNLIKHSGEKYFADQFSNCFTKQEYLLLEQDVKLSYFDQSKRFRSGIHVGCVPKDDCFTVVQLLNLLSSDTKAKMYPYHKSFTYERISKKVEQKEKFYATKEMGSSFTLVYNATRANVSLNCKVYGYKVTEEGDVQPSTTYRNFTCVKDGIKNVATLPISMSEETFQTLVENEVLQAGEEWSITKVFEVPLESLPVINRDMTKGKVFSSQVFCVNHVKKLKLQAERKYLKSRSKAAEKEEDEGEEKEVYEKKEKVPSLDSYKARELLVKVAKCSSLPTVNEKLLSKLDGGKMTVSEKLMKEVHDAYEAADDKGVFSAGRMASILEELEKVNRELEQVKFGILATKLWFSDEDVEDTYGNLTTSITFEGTSYDVTVVIQEKTIEL